MTVDYIIREGVVISSEPSTDHKQRLTAYTDKMSQTKEDENKKE